MSDELKKLLEGLPIKVWSRDAADIYGVTQSRLYFAHVAGSGNLHHAIAARVILRLMDEYEEPKKPEPKPTLMENSTRSSFSPPRCEKHNRQMVLAWYDRPGSPPGNGWYCPECATGREPSDQTLWQLIQCMPHEQFQGRCAHDCRRCQVEQWARERAAQWTQNAQDYGQRNRRENEIAWSITEAHVVDLGVPEEQ